MANSVAHNETRIRVLLVDDSPIALKALQKILSSDPDIDIVGTARNGAEALELIPDLNPDVICADLYMPVVDGLELTHEVMDRYPRPILVISVAVREDEPRNAFDLLEAGALDVFPKPRGGLDPHDRELKMELVHRIKRLAGVSVVRRPRAHPSVRRDGAEKPPTWHPVNLVVIGASTGGPQALVSILPRLPADFSAPIICVQHIGEGFLEGLVNWLNARSQLTVKTAEDGEVPRSGVVYFPAEGHHLEIGRDGRLYGNTAQPINGLRPSIDFTMKSAAKYLGSGVLGVLLSGMGSDGAEGLLAIRRAGGITLAQNAETSVVFGMAERAGDIGAVNNFLPLDNLAGALIEAVEH